MNSPQWFRRRETWVQEWTQRNPDAGPDASPQCRVCGRVWTLRTDDLHHVTYDRLGAELFEDLVPLCREDHTALHDLYDHSPAWRRLGRAAATAGIIAALRRQRHLEQGGSIRG